MAYVYCEHCGTRATLCRLHEYSFRVLQGDGSLARIEFFCFTCRADRFHAPHPPRQRPRHALQPQGPQSR